MNDISRCLYIHYYSAGMGSQQTGESKLGLENKGHQMLMKMGKKKILKRVLLFHQFFTASTFGDLSKIVSILNFMESHFMFLRLPL